MFKQRARKQGSEESDSAFGTNFRHLILSQKDISLIYRRLVRYVKVGSEDANRK